MARKSSVTRQPPEIQDKIGQLLTHGRTLDEILGVLNTLDLQEPISRSALGRHAKRENKLRERLLRNRELAESLVRTLDDDSEVKAPRLNLALLESLITEIVERSDPDAEDEASGETDKSAASKRDDKNSLHNPMGAMLMAKAMDHMAKARKNNAELVLKLKMELQKELHAKVATEVDKVAKEAGMSASTVEQIKSRILGIPVK